MISSDWHHFPEFIQSHHGEPLALATLISVDGSSYRRTGARLLINSAGRHIGSLSGGCLEDGIARVALGVMTSGQARTETIDTQPHFGCPGTLTILIEKVAPNSWLSEVASLILKRETFTLTTSDHGTSLGESEGFQEQVAPRPRLVVIGWTADQEPLFQLAHTLNWDCHRIVKEEGMIKELPMVSAESLSAFPAAELKDHFPPDETTAVLIMSHHLATDLAFLSSAAEANYPYLGLLGSRKRREKLLHELGNQGLLEKADWVESFYAPTGLDLGATHPSTIALSILAEIQAVFAETSGGFLSHKTGQIHAPTCS